RPSEERVVDEEVLRTRLAPDVPALGAGDRDRLDRLAARDMDDVERCARHTRELDRPVGRLALGLGRLGPRLRTYLVAAPYRGCRVTPCPWIRHARSPSYASSRS